MSSFGDLTIDLSAAVSGIGGIPSPADAPRANDERSVSALQQIVDAINRLAQNPTAQAEMQRTTGTAYSPIPDAMRRADVPGGGAYHDPLIPGALIFGEDAYNRHQSLRQEAVERTLGQVAQQAAVHGRERGDTRADEESAMYSQIEQRQEEWDRRERTVRDDWFREVQREASVVREAKMAESDERQRAAAQIDARDARRERLDDLDAETKQIRAAATKRLEEQMAPAGGDEDREGGGRSVTGAIAGTAAAGIGGVGQGIGGGVGKVISGFAGGVGEIAAGNVAGGAAQIAGAAGQAVGEAVKWAYGPEIRGYMGTIESIRQEYQDTKTQAGLAKFATTGELEDENEWYSKVLRYVTGKNVEPLSALGGDNEANYRDTSATPAELKRAQERVSGAEARVNEEENILRDIEAGERKKDQEAEQAGPATKAWTWLMNRLGVAKILVNKGLGRAEEADPDTARKLAAEEGLRAAREEQSNAKKALDYAKLPGQYDADRAQGKAEDANRYTPRPTDPDSYEPPDTGHGYARSDEISNYGSLAMLPATLRGHGMDPYAAGRLPQDMQRYHQRHGGEPERPDYRNRHPESGRTPTRDDWTKAGYAPPGGWLDNPASELKDWTDAAGSMNQHDRDWQQIGIGYKDAQWSFAGAGVHR